MRNCVRSYSKIRCSSGRVKLDLALLGLNIKEGYFTLVAHSLASAVCHTHTHTHLKLITAQCA
jgi:hypothetical protein